jgi:hypothetical protein
LISSSFTRSRFASSLKHLTWLRSLISLLQFSPSCTYHYRLPLFMVSHIDHHRPSSCFTHVTSRLAFLFASLYFTMWLVLLCWCNSCSIASSP